MARRAAPSVEDVAQHPQLVSHRRLSPELISSVLQRLEQLDGFSSAFAREAMRQAPPEDLADRWRRTSEALSKAGRQYSLGDEAFRQTLALFQEPWLLAACQAGAVAGRAPLVVDAALAKDGSEASYDALMAELARALADTDDWQLRHKLKRLKRYARPTPRWQALDAMVDGELRRRTDAMAARPTFAKALGLELPLLGWSIELRGSGGRHVWLLIEDDGANLQLEYRRADGSREPQPTDVRALPQVLAQLAERDGFRWNWSEPLVRTNLRGKKREQFLAWLRGERPSPSGS